MNQRGVWPPYEAFEPCDLFDNPTQCGVPIVMHKPDNLTHNTPAILTATTFFDLSTNNEDNRNATGQRIRRQAVRSPTSGVSWETSAIYDSSSAALSWASTSAGMDSD